MHVALERPNTNNYFLFYGLEEKYDIDVTELKNLFIEKSKLYHPDFYADDPKSQNIAVSISSYNNIAYKTLGNDIRRAQYLIDLKLSGDDENQTLPQTFLMEMMDLNESIDEMQEQDKPSILEQINGYKGETLETIQHEALASNWHEARTALLKWKYLERLETRLL